MSGIRYTVYGIRFCVVAVCCLLMVDGLLAQGEVVVALSAESQSDLPHSEAYTVGDPISITLAVTHPTGYRVIPFDYPEVWGGLEVTGWTQMAIVANEDGTETTTQQVELVAWVPAEYATERLEFMVSDMAGNLQTVSAESIPITVESVLTGEETMRDIKPQASLPFPPTWPRIVLALLGTAIVFGVLIAFGIRGRNRRRVALGLPIVDTRPAHVIALEELDTIERRNLPSDGNFSDHYDLVTDTLRRYVGRVYGVPAIDRTTREIARDLVHVDQLPSELREELVGLLNSADFVKFAKATPDINDATLLPDEARRFIHATMQKEAA